MKVYWTEILDTLKSGRFIPLLGGIFSFFIFIWYIYNNSNPQVLIKDEIFYYFQGKALEKFDFIWFENSSSFLLPFSIAILPIDNITALRILNALLMALSIYFFAKFVQEYVGALITGFSVFLIAINYQIIDVSHLLMSEPLYFLFLFLFLRSYLSSFSTKFTVIRQGVLAGFSILARVSGLNLLFFLAAHVLLTLKKENQRSITEVLKIGIISLVMVVPFLWITDFRTLLNKTAGFVGTGNRISMLLDVVWRFFAPVQLIYAVSFLFALRGIIVRRNTIVNSFLLFIFVFFVTLLFSGAYIFERYLVIPVTFFYVILFYGINHLFESRMNRYVATSLLFLIFASGSLYNLFQKEAPYNMYYLNLPSKSCTELNEFRAGSSLEYRSTPDFSVPPGSQKTYMFIFNIKEKSDLKSDLRKDQLVLSYISDSVDVKVKWKGLTVFRQYQPSAWSRPYVFDLSEIPGDRKYELKLLIKNEWNIGGIGQVLLCDRDFTEKNFL